VQSHHALSTWKLLTPASQGQWTSQSDTTALGSPKASVESLSDQAALEFSHAHKDAQLEPPYWVVVAGVDTLGGADQRDSKPLQLVEDQGQVGQ
jgi:hypothetical protein